MDKNQALKLLKDTLQKIINKNKQNNKLESPTFSDSFKQVRNNMLKNAVVSNPLKNVQNNMLKNMVVSNPLKNAQNNMLKNVVVSNPLKNVQNNMLKNVVVSNPLKNVQNNMLRSINAFDSLKQANDNIIKITGGLNYFINTKDYRINNTDVLPLLDSLKKINSIDIDDLLSVRKNLSNKSQKLEIPSTIIKNLSIEEYKNILSNKLNENDIEIIKLLSKNCWVLPKELANTKKFYNLVNTNNESKINDFIIDYFSQDNYKRLNTYFEEIRHNILSMKSNLSNEYASFSSNIINIFRENQFSSQVLIPSLFVLLEFINSTGKVYRPFDSNTSGIKFYIGGVEKNKDTLKYSMYLVGRELYLNFDDYKKNGYKNINRNAVQHGKANPNELKIDNFIKLSILCNAFSFESI